MAKRNFFTALLIGGALAVVCWPTEADDPYKTDIFLSNLEALASGEDENGSESKTESTCQVGPFTDDEGKVYYWICTETTCSGRGVIECEYNYECSGYKYL